MFVRGSLAVWCYHRLSLRFLCWRRATVFLNASFEISLAIGLISLFSSSRRATAMSRGQIFGFGGLSIGRGCFHPRDAARSVATVVLRRIVCALGTWSRSSACSAAPSSRAGHVGSAMPRFAVF